jgi:chemotaxis protein MotB
MTRPPFGADDEGGGGHDGAGMMRWLITYADLITLLLAFFIVLYALNRTQQIKFAMVAKALARNFDQNGTIVGQSPGPSIITGLSGTTVPPGEAATLAKVQQQVAAAVAAAGLQSQVHIVATPEGLLLRVEDSLLYAPGSAALSPSAVNLLTQVGRILATVPNQVEVSGFTDSTPIHTAQFSSNWQLSAMRAANVAQVLADASGQGARFFVSAFSKYRPVASNATPAGRQANRHVDILILTPQAAAAVAPPLTTSGG